jgi:hypothetical protein
VMISQFFINGDDLGIPEFICLYNPSSTKVDVSGYRVTKGITATLPEGTFLNGRSFLYLTDDANGAIWDAISRKVYLWEAGKLSNDGESIQLEDSFGIVVDYLVYDKQGLWPAEGFVGEGMFNLITPGLDNHFPESWEVQQASLFVSTPSLSEPKTFTLYPNPTRDKISIDAPGLQNRKIEIYNLTGRKLGEFWLDQGGKAALYLSDYESGILLIRVGQHVEKVVLIKD